MTRRPPNRPPPTTPEAISDLAGMVAKVASAVTPLSAAPGCDAAGGTVGSLTEAVMGVTAGLHAIAGAISDLADAVRDRGGEG